MFLRQLVESEADWKKYLAALHDLASFLDDCVRELLKARDLLDKAAARDRMYHHATVSMLVRHTCELVDGITVLAAQGCAEPSKPLLRCAFEASLGVRYILEAHAERRGLSYQVAHAHRRIKMYDRMKEDSQAGRDLRKILEVDPVLGKIDLPNMDWDKRINNLMSMFAQPEFAPIEQEWQAVRKARKHDPQWYELFGGPYSIRELALRTGQVSCYEFLYRPWSDSVHAASCLESIGQDESGMTVMRPIRHPEGLQLVAFFATTICLELSRLLIQVYALEKAEEFRAYFVQNLREHYQALAGPDLFIVPWK